MVIKSVYVSRSEVTSDTHGVSAKRKPILASCTRRKGGTPVPQTAFRFPGQGAQTVGMGRQLYETLPAARRLYDEAAEVLGYNLAAVCANGPAERLNSTVVSQPAIFVTSLAAL